MATTDARPARDETHHANGRHPPAQPPESSPRGRAEEPVKVTAKGAGRRIRGIAAVSESLDVRRRLRRLARQVESGSRDAQQMAFVEAAIGDCLDDVTTAPARERWLLCEAATWGLAWMARSRRAGGSAGGLLERMVKLARSAQAMLAGGDTSPAVFTLALARLFCDIEACRCLERDAAAALSAEIARLVSTGGVVCLTGSAAAIDRVSHWGAARDVANATGGLPWDDDTENALATAVAATLPLLGDHGRMLAGAGRMPAAFSAPLLHAARTSGHRRLSRTAKWLEGGGKGRGTGRRLLPRDLHDPAAAAAILRSGWESGAVRVLVEYRGAVPRLEIAVGDRLLVTGPWQWRVSLAGRPLEALGPWTLACYESDRHASFLEIAAPLAGGMQIERQVVMLPDDRIVLVADAVTRPAAAGSATEQGALRLETVVPLAASLEGEAAEDTREVLVYDTKPRLLALPLALPEWRSVGRGSLAPAPDGLLLEHDATGSRCYSPLWMDLDASRQGLPLTWRQLTVADTRRNLPPHQAVGFRVQSGLEQWLVYRSLDATRNRTVLGCNLSSEFMLGRIGRTGVVKAAIEID